MNAPFPAPGAGAPELDVAIIGAGFSGLGMAIKLKEAGCGNFRIFEKAGDLGGTWLANDYPGCACDVPSHLYSYSFEQNPEWTRMYSPQPEIWDYLKRVATKHGLRAHIRCNTAVTSAQYDESRHCWRVRLATGEETTARFLVSGVGALCIPAYPKISGIGEFAGKAFHSAEWDHDYDLAGKTVAVVGTGASAIQFVPQIAPKVKRLYLFQRTPPWILPRPDRAVSDREKKLFRAFPPLLRLFRDAIYWQMEMRALGFTVNPRLMGAVEKMARKHLEDTIPNAELRAALTPDYTIGCKRILISNDYYPALTRDNVEVVTEPISRASRSGLVTAEGKERKVDAVIYGTGFKATEPLSGIDIRGRGGRALADDWKSGPEAYYGISVAGYPNFFILLGPNTGLGHNSVVFMIESQVRYALRCMNWLARDGMDEIEVRHEVQRAFNDRLQEEMARTVWQSGCKSWYQTDTGKNTTIWPSFTVRYWWKTRAPRRGDFRFARSEGVRAAA